MSPFILGGRLVLQELTRLQLGWDEEIPLQQRIQWEAWLAGLSGLASVEVPRCFRPKGFGDIVSAQLHHFADASSQAYGTVSYLRLTNSRTETHCTFIFGKARVAPLKVITIPRLELAAATMSVRVNAMLERILNIPIQDVIYWTDSTTVLRYIRNDRSRYHTYVANRLTVIRDGSSPCQWRYVGTKLNPADDATRGNQSERWLQGPDFLRHDEEHWPEMPAVMATEEADPEVKKEVEVAAVAVDGNSTEELIKHYSSWYRLRRAVARLRRSMRILQERKFGTRDASYSGMITVDKLDQAERALIRVVQSAAFPEELSVLSTVGSGHQVKKTSSVQTESTSARWHHSRRRKARRCTCQQQRTASLPAAEQGSCHRAGDQACS